MAGVLPLVFVMATSLVITGCGGGSDSYSEPEATKSVPVVGQTQSVLIDAATLNGWIDQGLANNDEGWEKIVILNGNVAAGRIPGSQIWTGASGIVRYEGPVRSDNMVLDGPTMDSLLQKHGIDERTTVVFANGSGAARNYFMFRYWGFPKERLKVLDGGVAAWTAAGYALTTVEPVITPSD
jgi:3-mercaptopyruvate sulfurtransferase SseA